MTLSWCSLWTIVTPSMSHFRGDSLCPAIPTMHWATASSTLTSPFFGLVIIVRLAGHKHLTSRKVEWPGEYRHWVGEEMVGEFWSIFLALLGLSLLWSKFKGPWVEVQIDFLKSSLLALKFSSILFSSAAAPGSMSALVFDAVKSFYFPYKPL